MFSSLMADALLAGRHVVSLQPGAVDSDMNLGGPARLVPRATTQEELIAALMAPPPGLAALRAALKDSCARLERALLGAGRG
jgi:hypothetical protein